MGRLLLISSSENGQRKVQHRNVIDAARGAGVKLIVYTSIPHADTTPLMLAEEHRDTEAALRESGVPFVLLRNGWYTEVHTWRLPATLARGVLAGAGVRAFLMSGSSVCPRERSARARAPPRPLCQAPTSHLHHLRRGASLISRPSWRGRFLSPKRSLSSA